MALATGATVGAAGLVDGGPASGSDPSDRPPGASSIADVVQRAATLATKGIAHDAVGAVVFEDAMVRVTRSRSGDGIDERQFQFVPVALWYPTAKAAAVHIPAAAEGQSPAATTTYPHAISVAKIARVLLNAPEGTPRWLDRDVPLRATPGVVKATPGSDLGLDPGVTPRGAVILCHGYLGSRWGREPRERPRTLVGPRDGLLSDAFSPGRDVARDSIILRPARDARSEVPSRGFDLVDYAEALAAAGFLVAAPEFAEALSNPETTPRAPTPSASRDQIMAAVLSDVVRTRFGVRDRIAIVGQSAGAGTATSTPGRFARVAISGFRPPADDAAAALTTDPLLVIASEGDGVISLLPRESGPFGPYPGIKAAVNALPVKVARFTSPREFLMRVIESPAGAEEAAARRRAREGVTPRVLATVTRRWGLERGEGDKATSSVPRVAFLTYERNGQSGAERESTGARALPCHISFLSSRTNDAMIDVLRPLLPVARALSVPVLDFDVYAGIRDSDEVAADLVPAVVAWLSRVV